MSDTPDLAWQRASCRCALPCTVSRENGDEMPTAEIAAEGRWCLGGYAQVYPWAQCRYCGRAQAYDCPAVECLACGSRQCNNRAECSVCLIGWLPGWSRTIYSDYTTGSRGTLPRQCSYKGCTGEAVAYANHKRSRRVCAEHLHKASRQGRTLAEHIAEQVAQRDAGTGWQRWRFVR